MPLPPDLDHALQDNMSAARDLIINVSFYLLAITFLYYDHFLTFSDEVSYIWRRPKSASSYWFFANRYLAFTGNIFIAVFGFRTMSVSSCETYGLCRQLFLVVNVVLVGVLLTIRIFALYGRDWRILWFMLGTASVLLGISIWSLFGQHSYPAKNVSGCHIGISKETAVRLAVAWECLFVYDSLLFILTVRKTFTARHRHELGGLATSVPILSLILRDGAIYFAVMAFANFCNIVTFYIAGPLFKGGLSTFAACISSTMMSRLMLNLHEIADIGILSVDHEKEVLSTQITIGGTLDSSLIDSQWERSSTAIEGRSPYGQFEPFEPGPPRRLQSASSVPDSPPQPDLSPDRGLRGVEKMKPRVNVRWY